MTSESFDWDDPRNWPGDTSWPGFPGESLEGRVTRMSVRPGSYGRLSLCVELDGDGRERWCNSRLWRCLGEARVQVGDMIRVTRGKDDPPRPGQARPSTTWTVERLRPQPSKPPWGQQPEAPQQPSGPTW